MKKISILLCLIIIGFTLHAGDTLRVLFIGNSYTAVNNLPDVINKIAKASGDSLYYQVNAPGGYTLQQHSADPTTLGLIAQGNWDYVVLQEQSQRPSFHDGQVATDVYPYARKLDSFVHDVSGDCAQVMFYMTWGKKNGDASNCAVWPPVCTYDGMDSLLQLRYSIMAEDNNSMISPVAKLWHHLRDNAPGIELYQADESHPSAAGTYAAAMSFYTMLFDKNPINNTFNYTLSASDANTIKTAAQSVVCNNRRYWKRFYPYPYIDSIVVHNTGSNTFHFEVANPNNILGYEWDFGDGSPHSYLAGPMHTYSDNDTYNVCLSLHGLCGDTTICLDTTSIPTGINEYNSMANISIYPNPTADHVQVKGLKGKTFYTILSMTGTVIERGVLSPRSAEIRLNGLASGVYLLKLKNESGQVLNTKLQKE